MATSTQKSWKLEDFTAHNSNVKCLALGHKSGRVLVTGGDDKQVNLWAVGKPDCIISLSGHTTAIECVRFGQAEDTVCSGSHSGALKIWDLNRTKLTRTFIGHKGGIKCMDFHPYGELLTSGSVDTGIKLWDIRKQGCVFTYTGHAKTVNSLKFSPDGQWIASAGEEGIVKLWDLRVGKLLKEFSEHKEAATTVEFHPHEFLLASGGMDKTVHFWDLESFKLVSSVQNVSAIRCLHFSQDGECLYTGTQDLLEVHRWEPARTLDTVTTSWGKVQDIAIAQTQLFAASFNGSNVKLFVCDLNQITSPTNFSESSPFAHGNPSRKSFTKDNLKKKVAHVKTTIEEGDNKSGSDPDDEISHVELPALADRQEIFQPSRSHPAQPQIIQNLSTSMTNLHTTEKLNVEDNLTPSVSMQPPLLFTKPVSVRNSIKSSPPVQRHLMHSNSQVKLNSQSVNNSSGKNVNNCAKIPPLRQSITPFIGKKSISNSNINQPMGPQRSNSTLTSRVAPMAAVAPVVGGNGKSKSRAPSPDSPKHFFKRQNSCQDSEHGYESDFPVKINTSIRHSPSDPALNRPNTGQMRSNSMARNFINSGPLSARNLSVVKKNNRAQVTPSLKVDIRTPQPRPVETIEKDEFVPIIPDKPIGLEVGDFLPNSYVGSERLGYNQRLTEMSEVEVISSVTRGHDSMMTILTNRQRALQIIYSLWHSKDVKSAIDSAVRMNDLSVIVDLLGALNLKPTIWNLDVCNLLLRPIAELLQSKYEMYVTVGCTALKLILRNFGPVIKSNVEAPLHTIGVDVSREERYHKCLSCYEKLEAMRALINKKQIRSGQVGSSFREINLLMDTLV
ncbi:katanin p80 WD40 repeat-containing subunit B1-like isoform X2 [Microplitis mediator]|uniref:katanin p80 WD40 repeat-containing subunit B1-like isoform X2 n=1 Tax=Microplitis mediator TaxID=375433 RepID=UPI002557A244|nr:katanin p80 WD40 repeat-containing subunit B1-like isoform X2 [Microplitis mediator]